MIRIGFVVIGLLLCAWTFAGGYLSGETIRTDGEVILFELAPVDPRALFLGDYMTLNYDLGLWPDVIEEQVDMLEIPEARSGVAVMRLQDGVGRIVRFEEIDDLAANERLIRYVKGDWDFQLSIGGDRYYFQSGTGERYENAAYGIFRVMPDGRALLSGLADEKKRPILIAGEAPSMSDVEPAP